MTPKLKRQLEIGFSLMLLAFVVLFFIESLGYPPKTRQLPLIVQTLGIIFIVVHLINVFFQSPSNNREMENHAIRWRPVFLSFVALAVFLVLTYFIGMTLSSGAIVYGCGIVFGAKNRIKLLTFSVLTIILVYLVFVKAAGVRLFPGVLFGYF